MDAGAGEIEWVVNKDRYKYDAIFDTLGPMDGKVTGASKFLHFIECVIYFKSYFSNGNFPCIFQAQKLRW